jgi:hypothetical protein
MPTDGGDPAPFPSMVERAKLAGWEAGTDTVEAMAGYGYAESSLVPGLPPSLESGRGQLTQPTGGGRIRQRGPTRPG